MEEVIAKLSQIFQMSGFAALAILIFIFLLPGIISGLRKAEARWIIFILNVVLIAAAFINILLPVVIWLMLMIAAVTGKKEVDWVESAGVTIVNAHRRER